MQSCLTISTCDPKGFRGAGTNAVSAAEAAGEGLRSTKVVVVIVLLPL